MSVRRGGGYSFGGGSDGDAQPPVGGGGAGKPTEGVRRINVAVTDETVAALLNLVEREGVTLTEALRRLTGYGDFVYRKIREEEATLLVKRKWRAAREVTIL